MPIQHRVGRGECISSIAFEHGFAPDTIWDHPGNEGLRRQREDPNVLLEGDIVTIPDPKPKEMTVRSGQRHVFRRKGVPETLRVRFLDEDRRPRVDVPYVLEVEGETSTGRTGPDGFVVAYIRPNLARARLTLGEGRDRQVFDLDLGGLDPITELTGLRARLSNLGYGCDSTGEALDEATREALRSFQKDHGLEVTGEADAATLDALHKQHHP